MHEDSYKKISEYLWQIVLILLGGLMLGLSFVVEKEPGKIFATFNGIGVSLLLSGFLGIFMNVLFNRKDAKYKVCEEWKIKNIYASRAIANLEIDACQEKAKNLMDIHMMRWSLIITYIKANLI